MTAVPRKITFAPYVTSGESVSRIMLTVAASLTPAAAASVFYYGARPAVLAFICVAGCFLWEWLFCLLRGRPSTLGDGSALVTGLLLALCLPPYAPLWIGVTGSFIAIVVGKMVFGGLGCNPFNPALVARAALLVSFPAQMTAWKVPSGAFLKDGVFLDAVSGATTLGVVKDAHSVTAALGASISGSAGEVSAAVLLAGGLFLIYKRIITWHIPTVFIGTVFLLSAVLWTFDKNGILNPFDQITGGGLVLGAFFMATDYSSSPMYRGAKIIFAAGCGVITVLIRLYGGYPEGVGFAILIMNSAVPVLDGFFAPKPFGYVDERGD